MVKLYEDKGFIWVMDKVKLTEKGVMEGSGPAADRVQKVYDTFMSEAKALNKPAQLLLLFLLFFCYTSNYSKGFKHLFDFVTASFQPGQVNV